MMPIPVTEIITNYMYLTCPFCFERCRLTKNYQAFQELCPFYCVFYLPKMWWIHLDLGFLKCLLFIVTRLEKPHKCVYKCPTDNTAKVLVLLFNN